MCGIEQSDGDFILTMDDDLQHSPEDIKLFWRKFRKNYDAVIGTYPINDSSQNIVRRFSSSFFYHLITLFYKKPTKNRNSAFRIFTRKSGRFIVRVSYFRPIIGLNILSVSGKVGYVEISHNASKRKGGGSRYGYSGLLSILIQMFSSATVLPIRLISVIGFISFYRVDMSFNILFNSMVLQRKYIARIYFFGNFNCYVWRTCTIFTWHNWRIYQAIK